MSFKPIICVWLFISIAFSGNIAFSQTETDPVIQEIIEDMSEDLAEDFDFSELTERLSFYRDHPAEVNRITREQLQELFFLTPLQINAFLEHRIENGKIIDLLELQSIDGFDLATIRRFTNFVYLGLPNSISAVTLKNLVLKGSNDLMIRYGQYLQKQKGYRAPEGAETSAYVGTPERLLLRYRYNYGRNVSASINMEKDAGEQFFPANKSIGFDFSSANVFIRNAGRIKKAVIGDYSLQFGQGLTLWSGLTFGKGAMITTLAKPELGLQPYKSNNEFLFFRGLASTINYRFVDITPFVSMRSIDAGIEESDVDLPIVRSMPQSGLHRTKTEIANKNSLLQTVYGANLRYAKPKFNAGVTAYQTRFDAPVQAGQFLYNKFHFEGSMLTNVGLNYGFTIKNTYVFGEAAYSGNRRLAFVNGLMSSISPQVSVVLLHRHYPHDYQSFFNQAVAEASNSVNENGLYAGLHIKPATKWDVSVYSDYFRFPWLKFGVDAPSAGYELFGQVSYQPSKTTKWSMRYKMEQKQDNDDIDNAINTLLHVSKQSYRLEFSSKISKTITLRNRLEASHYQKETQKRELGWLAYQDVLFDPVKARYSGNIRIALFNTPGFNSRIYAYENDVLYSYSIPAYQNEGLRFYINGRYRFSRKMDMWLRYSLSKYKDVTKIGSGQDQIDGSKRSEIKVQLRYQY
ncbi:MAG TPA: hypothetical protein VLZ28_05280 [Daejeonella sp.]|nr:hypothetical protein [Daejeonella sp.]